VHGSLGRSDIVDKAVAISGLDAWVYCKPYLDAEAAGICTTFPPAHRKNHALLVADVTGGGSATASSATDAAVQLSIRQTQLVR
jgi:hypothetical protein